MEATRIEKMLQKATYRFINPGAAVTKNIH